jgi:integrase
VEQQNVDRKYQPGIINPKEAAEYFQKSVSWVYKNWEILGGRKLKGSIFFHVRRTSMSVYSVKGKGWRFDFILHGARYSSNWFGTKAEAREAEAKRREEIKSPSPEPELLPVMETTPTAMGFLELANRRLDHVKDYNSKRHYTDHFYMAKKWIGEWETLSCEEVSRDKIPKFLLKRAEVSPYTANKDLRYLRALFNFGISRNWISENPTRGLSFFPVEKRLKYIPSKKDVLSVIAAADPDTQDYLWTIKETMGRMGEINRLTWSDVNLEKRYVVLYTRKKKGGHLTPRKVPMTQKLFEVLSRRHEERAKDKPWVFWQRYWDRKEEKWIEGPYRDRKSIMKTLCKNTKVRYFRFHALRHLGASVLDRANVNIGSIQRLLGHENRTTTEIYLHSIGEAEQEAMKIFEKAG